MSDINQLSDVVLVTIPVTKGELKQLRAFIVKRDAMISIGFDRAQLGDEIIARLIAQTDKEAIHNG